MLAATAVQAMASGAIQLEYSCAAAPVLSPYTGCKGQNQQLSESLSHCVRGLQRCQSIPRASSVSTSTPNAETKSTLLNGILPEGYLSNSLISCSAPATLAGRSVATPNSCATYQRMTVEYPPSCGLPCRFPVRPAQLLRERNRRLDPGFLLQGFSQTLWKPRG